MIFILSEVNLSIKSYAELYAQGIILEPCCIDITLMVSLIMILSGIGLAIYCIRKELNTTQNKFGLLFCTISLIYLLVLV
jgi:hypothetical protein